MTEEERAMGNNSIKNNSKELAASVEKKRTSTATALLAPGIYNPIRFRLLGWGRRNRSGNYRRH